MAHTSQHRHLKQISALGLLYPFLVICFFEWRPSSKAKAITDMQNTKAPPSSPITPSYQAPAPLQSSLKLSAWLDPDQKPWWLKHQTMNQVSGKRPAPCVFSSEHQESWRIWTNDGCGRIWFSSALIKDHWPQRNDVLKQKKEQLISIVSWSWPVAMLKWLTHSLQK